MIKRGIRFILKCVCCTALAAWIVLAILWGRSFFQGDCFVYGMAGTVSPSQPSSAQLGKTFVLISGSGGICVGVREAFVPTPTSSIPYREWQRFSKPVYPTPAMWSVMSGTIWIVSTGSVTVSNSAISISGNATMTMGAGGLTVVGPSPTTAPATPRGTTTIAVRNVATTQNYIVNGQAVSVSGGTVIFRNGAITANNGTVSLRGGMMSINTTSTPVAPVTPTSMPTIMTGVLGSPSTAIAGDNWFLYYSAGREINPATNTGDITRVLILPYWSIIAALSIPALLGVMNMFAWFRYRKRTREGCCTVCGYDLRATPERCPECGTISEQSLLEQGPPMGDTA